LVKRITRIGEKPFTYAAAPGVCIYCGSSSYAEDEKRKLGREHIFPEGMGGQLILPEASCRACERLINGFESFVQARTLNALRTRLNIKSKKGTKRPTTIDAEFLFGEEMKRLPVPIGEYPIRMHALTQDG